MKISMGKKSREAWPMPFIGPTSGSSGNRSAPYCLISFFLKQFWLFRTQKSHCPSAPPSRYKIRCLLPALLAFDLCPLLCPIIKGKLFHFQPIFSFVLAYLHRSTMSSRLHDPFYILKNFCNFLKIKFNEDLT